MKADQSGFGIIEVLLIVVTIGLIGALGWIAYDRYVDQVDEDKASIETGAPAGNGKTIEQEPKRQPEPARPRMLASGTFGSGDGYDLYGTFQAEGYASTVERDGEQYVFFQISRTGNDNIFDFLELWKGNSFVQDNAIGVGCLSDGRITYSNKHRQGIGNHSISAVDTATIMSATPEKPVALDIERLQPVLGGGAPTCYSLFASFEVIR